MSNNGQQILLIAYSILQYYINLVITIPKYLVAMVALEIVRTSNAKLRNLSPGLVAVFGMVFSFFFSLFSMPTLSNRMETKSISKWLCSGCDKRYR